MQFSVPGKVFALELVPEPEMLGQGTAVLRSHHDSIVIRERKIGGEALRIQKMLVANPDFFSREGDLSKWIDTKDIPSQIELLEGDELFGRFYVESLGLESPALIRGAFLYKDKFWTVQQAENPFIRLAAKHFKAASSGDDLIVSAQSLEGLAQEQAKLNLRCGHDHLKFNSHYHGAPSYLARKIGEQAFLDLGRRGRGRYPLFYGLPGRRRLGGASRSGCPSQRKILHLGMVADCNYMEAFGGNEEKVKAQIINDVALASSIFEEAYNIQLGIISIDVNPKCSPSTSSTSFNVPCEADIDLDERLSRFSQWRGTQTDQAGLYHLVTGCQGGSVVGIAWLHQVCQARTLTSREGENVSGTAVTVLVRNQYSVMAHEITHNLGGVHDCDRATCEQCDASGDRCQCCQCEGCDCQGQFIMDPASGGRNVNRFSPCTIREVCEKVPVLAATCLREPGSLKTITRSQCGNGIKEEGEECDCGDKCDDDPCCGKDCRLKSGAKCADINDKCCRQCSIIPASEKYVCSPTQGSCQLESRCDGKSGDCPKNVLFPDGTPCKAASDDQLGDDVGPLTCASGQCTSRSAQCLAVGTRLGFLGECKGAQGQCTVVCQTSQGCMALEANFIDGTRCGWRGKCYQGKCDENIFVTYAYQYYPVFGLLGGIVLFFLLFWAIRTIAACIKRQPIQRL